MRKRQNCMLLLHIIANFLSWNICFELWKNMSSNYRWTQSLKGKKNIYIYDRHGSGRGILPCSTEWFLFLPLVFTQDVCSLIIGKWVQSPVTWTETQGWRGRKKDNTEKWQCLVIQHLCCFLVRNYFTSREQFQCVMHIHTGLTKNPF